MAAGGRRDHLDIDYRVLGRGRRWNYDNSKRRTVMYTLMDALGSVHEELDRRAAFDTRLKTEFPCVIGYCGRMPGCTEFQLTEEGLKLLAIQKNLQITITDNYKDKYMYERLFPYVVSAEFDGGKAFCLCESFPDWTKNKIYRGSACNCRERERGGAGHGKA
jgi:hypothetical protein